jgi:hypothetical protein
MGLWAGRLVVMCMQIYADRKYRERTDGIHTQMCVEAERVT